MEILDLVKSKGFSKAEIARECKITKPAVQQWKNHIPARFCPTIERLTGIPCETLNPQVEWSVLRESHESNNSET
tara:strand:+ start:221 stop:445 length:225 start_codon:yes stop_codon:yes gene_type:complete